MTGQFVRSFTLVRKKLRFSSFKYLRLNIIIVDVCPARNGILFCGLKLKPIPQIVHHCLLVCCYNCDLRFLAQGFPSLLSVLAISLFWYTYIPEKVENEIKTKKSTRTKYDIKGKGCNSFRLIV